MSAAKLGIGPNLSLPIDAVTEPIGMFANRGKGKSNAAHRLVEQLYHAGLPSVVLDVKGDWYGIRSSADGRSAGLPFLIFGGEHFDVPLEPDSGVAVGRFTAEHHVPTIVDLSQFSKTQARRWAMEFAEELYRVNKDPLMLVVDEADILIPQRLAAELMRLLGAMEDIAKRGRQRGLGITVISQRVADVNKSVTDLLETLFLFTITGSRMRKAVLEWIDDHGDPEEARDIVATLSSLEPGECWLWSPSWLRRRERFTWLRIETFDSHATPKAGEVRRTLKTMADVDLAAVKESMSDVIERANANDPKQLQRRVAELERQLRQARTEQPPVEPTIETVEVPVVDEDLVRRLEEACSGISREAGGIAAVVDGLTVTMREAAARTAGRPSPPPGQALRGGVPGRGPVPASTPPAARQTRPEPSDGDVRLKAGARRMVEVLARFYPKGLSKQQLATLADVKQGGTFSEYFRAVLNAGLLEGRSNGTFAISPLAIDTLDNVDVGRGMTTDEIVAVWMPKLKAGARRMLELLLDRYPDGLSRAELGELADVKQGGTFSEYLRSLTKNGLAEETGGIVTAGETLFLGR